MDFQVLPHVVDAQGYARLFKVCKMWELEIAEQLLLAQEAAGHAHGDGEEQAGEDIAVSSPPGSAKKDRGLFIRIDSFSKPGQVNSFDIVQVPLYCTLDPIDRSFDPLS